jgi:hypothetical protein
MLKDVVNALLPTPTTQDGRNTAGPSQHRRNTPPLNTVVSLLPTPVASDGKRASSTYARGNPTLSGALLPTPTATDGKGGRNATATRANPDSKHHDGTTLTDAVTLLPTPTASLGDDKRGMPSERVAQMRFDQGKRNLDDAVVLLPTPRVSASRTIRGAALRQDSRSSPSIEQAIELALGELPREFTPDDELPASWGQPTTGGAKATTAPARPPQRDPSDSDREGTLDATRKPSDDGNT